MRASPYFEAFTRQEIVAECSEVRASYTGPTVDEVREEFDYFANCVLADVDCEADGEEGLADQQIIEAAETGDRISL